jgi:hypothetical protein
VSLKGQCARTVRPQTRDCQQGTTKKSLCSQNRKREAPEGWSPWQSHFPRMQYIVTLFSARSGHSIASPFLCVEYVGQHRNDIEIAILKEGGMRHGNAITKSDHSPPSVKKYQTLNDLWLFTHLLDLQIACRTMVD